MLAALAMRLLSVLTPMLLHMAEDAWPHHNPATQDNLGAPNAWCSCK
jgi:hypothetical protein